MIRNQDKLLTNNEMQRYSRQIVLPDFGISGQEKFKKASVLVVGAGGLGCPVLMELAAAGVGCLGIADHDRLELSNLHRQILFGDADVGRLKAEAAAEKLKNLNKHLKIKVFAEKIERENALEILADFDIILDCTDNFAACYLLNDACVKLGKPLVFGAVQAFTAQIAVFNLRDENGDFGPNYRDLFPEPPAEGSVPNCAENGVPGPMPGLIGSFQAVETYKIIAGQKSETAGSLLMIDLSDWQFSRMNLRKNPENPLNTANPLDDPAFDYDFFCGCSVDPVREMSAEQLHSLQKRDPAFRLIDVRSAEEREIENIGGEHFLLDELEDHLIDIPLKGTVVFYCRTGFRSAQAVKMLVENHAYSNVFSLKGGLEEWRRFAE